MKKQKFEFKKIPELGIEITSKPFSLEYSFCEFPDEISGAKVVSLEMLMQARNLAYNSNWKKYSFMKEFIVCTFSLDEISKTLGEGCTVDSDSNLMEIEYWHDWDRPSLGRVFLYRPITVWTHIRIFAKDYLIKLFKKYLPSFC